MCFRSQKKNYVYPGALRFSSSTQQCNVERESGVDPEPAEALVDVKTVKVENKGSRSLIFATFFWQKHDMWHVSVWSCYVNSRAQRAKTVHSWFVTATGSWSFGTTLILCTMHRSNQHYTFVPVSVCQTWHELILEKVSCGCLMVFNHPAFTGTPHFESFFWDNEKFEGNMIVAACVWKNNYCKRNVWHCGPQIVQRNKRSDFLARIARSKGSREWTYEKFPRNRSSIKILGFAGF